MAMSEPRRIAKRLTDGTDLAAAALLVSVFRDGVVRREAESIDLFQTLERAGCVCGVRRTPLGSQVAMVLLSGGPFNAIQGRMPCLAVHAVVHRMLPSRPEVAGRVRSWRQRVLPVQQTIGRWPRYGPTASLAYRSRQPSQRDAAGWLLIEKRSNLGARKPRRPTCSPGQLETEVGDTDYLAARPRSIAQDDIGA